MKFYFDSCYCCLVPCSGAKAGLLIFWFIDSNLYITFVSWKIVILRKWRWESKKFSRWQYVFMMGITDGRKDFDFHQQIICDVCGKYGRFQVFMTYTVLSLFFIPCFKWNKHYYVQTSCCNTVYELDAEIGKELQQAKMWKFCHSI